MTFLLTPEQHRILAANLLRLAGRPGALNKARAKQMAQNHENVAKMIERRDAMTPEQHRALAADYMKKAGTNSYWTHERAKQLAEEQRDIALEKQARFRMVSPSIAPH